MPVWGGRNVCYAAPAPTTDQYLCMQLEALKQMGSQASVLPPPPRSTTTPPHTSHYTQAHECLHPDRSTRTLRFSHRPSRQIRLYVLCAGTSRLPPVLGHSRRRKGKMWASSSCWETLPLVLSAQPLPITNRWPVPHSRVVCHAQQQLRSAPAKQQSGLRHYSFGQRERRWQSAGKSWGGEEKPPTIK